jgi:citrate lyase beta subunit
MSMKQETTSLLEFKVRRRLDAAPGGLVSGPMSPAPDAALVRAWLFCPGSRPERFAKALRTGADAVIVDLEDAVPAAQKDEARRHAVAWLTAEHTADAARCVRMNGVRTVAGLRDVLALVDAGAAPDHLVVPKSESADELAMLDAILRGACARTRLLPLVETARGLEAAVALAAAPRVSGLLLGGADLAADLGAEMSWEPLLFARARVVQAAATAGVAVVDVPHLALGDPAGLRGETERVRRLGFTGKLAIHPDQVAPIQTVFTPGDADVERARRIVAAAEAAAGGVVVIEGRMVDAPVVHAAARTIALASRRRA